MYDVLFAGYRHPFKLEYTHNGLRYPRQKTEVDIISLSDPIQVQVASIEGEIKGLEFILPLLSIYFMAKRTVQIKIDELKDQLNALTNEGNN